MPERIAPTLTGRTDPLSVDEPATRMPTTSTLTISTLATTPPPGVVATALVGLLRGYRLLLSPWLGNACRFEPTCSRYGIEALQTHGAGKGSVLTFRRVVRCHPWCDGGHDPVPPRRQTLTSSQH